MKHPVIIGVDAGGSSTVAARAVVVGDGLREERRVDAGPANASLRGLDAAASTIVDAVRSVAESQAIAAIHAGVAGGARREIASAISSALRAAFPSAHVTVGHDARIALRAGVPPRNQESS